MTGLSCYFQTSLCLFWHNADHSLTINKQRSGLTHCWKELPFIKCNVEYMVNIAALVGCALWKEKSPRGNSQHS